MLGITISWRYYDIRFAAGTSWFCMRHENQTVLRVNHPSRLAELATSLGGLLDGEQVSDISIGTGKHCLQLHDLLRSASRPLLADIRRWLAYVAGVADDTGPVRGEGGSLVLPGALYLPATRSIRQAVMAALAEAPEQANTVYASTPNGSLRVSADNSHEVTLHLRAGRATISRAELAIAACRFL